jgi:hypothetical protein
VRGGARAGAGRKSKISPSLALLIGARVETLLGLRRPIGQSNPAIPYDELEYARRLLHKIPLHKRRGVTQVERWISGVLDRAGRNVPTIAIRPHKVFARVAREYHMRPDEVRACHRKYRASKGLDVARDEDAAAED